jgi:hypothetical protein
MDWHNQHSKNNYTTKIHLHVQCIKIPMTFITEIEKFTLNFICKHKWTLCWRIPKAILNKKSNVGGITTLLWTVLQNHSNKNRLVLAQKQIWRPVEQNRGPGYESTQFWLDLSLSKSLLKFHFWPFNPLPLIFSTFCPVVSKGCWNIAKKGQGTLI